MLELTTQLFRFQLRDAILLLFLLELDRERCKSVMSLSNLDIHLLSILLRLGLLLVQLTIEFFLANFEPLQLFVTACLLIAQVFSRRRFLSHS